jgi:hypothetical protein
MMEENGMGLASVRSPQENYIGLFDFAIGTCSAARSEDRRQTGDAWGVSSPVATIDVVAPDNRSNEFLCDVVQLVGGFRAAEHAERLRPARAYFRANALDDAIERFFPRRFAMLSILADQWSGQAIASTVFHHLTSAHLEAAKPS